MQQILVVKMHELLIKSFDENMVYYKTNTVNKNKCNKCALVFIHGLSGNHTIWLPIMEHFNELGYPVIAFDLFGHGNSQTRNKPERFSINSFSRDIQHVLTKENAKKVILVGYSLGGMIAFEYCRNNPDNVHGIVALSTPPNNPLMYQMTPVSILAPLLTPIFKSFAFLIGGLASRFKKKKYAYIDYRKLRNYNGMTIILKDLQGTPASSYLWSFYHMLNYNVLGYADEINAKVLLISGDIDRIVDKKASMLLHKKLPNSEINIFEASDHLNPIRRPEKLNKVLEEFIGRLK